MKFSKALFWDVNPDLIDEDKHARFVIERVLTRGNIKDFRKLLLTYDRERIRRELVHCRSLDQKTIGFCCAFFDLKKEDFNCYTPTLLNQKH